jgi:hypothetical protein
MPAHRIGKLWKFKLSEVDAWVRSGGADEKRLAKEERGWSLQRASLPCTAKGLYGQDHTGTAQLEHEPHRGQKHSPGAAGPVAAASVRVPLLASPQRIAG